MTVWLGLLTAVSFGGGDFLAGVASRKWPSLVVVLYSHLIGATIMLITTMMVAGLPTQTEIIWGAAAGLALGLSNLIYFQALSTGQMGIVAAVAGVWSAVVPFGIGIILGERPSLLAMMGILFVIVAIALVSGGKSLSNETI